MEAPHVWVAKDDGSDIVRAEAIIGVGMDYNGHITARLAGGDGTTVTLVAADTHDSSHPPDDFHRQLLRVIAQLADAAGAFMIRPVCAEPAGWRWISEPL
jgi:hypothetical protein